MEKGIESKRKGERRETDISDRERKRDRAREKRSSDGEREICKVKEKDL